MADNPKTIGSGRGPDGRFQPGNRFGPGRPKGSKHRLAETLLFELAEDFDQHGREAIIACGEQNPANYLRIVSACIPKDFYISTENQLEELSTEEIDKMIFALRHEIAKQEGWDVDDADAADAVKPESGPN
jgi:hypothetical protein